MKKKSFAGAGVERGTDDPASKSAGTAADFASTLAACALMVAAAGALSSLPVFEIGHWEKAEPIVVVMHFAGALAFAALAILGTTDFRRLAAIVYHPIVLVPTAIGLWSLAAVPNAIYPMAVILGPPQSGQGTFWYLTLAALTACARLIRENRQLWLVVATVAIGIAFAVTGFRLRPMTGASQPLLTVGGYYAYIALALPLLALPMDGRLRLIVGAAGVIAAIAVLAVSRNLSAAFAFAVGMAIAGSLLIWRQRSGGAPLSRWPGAGMVATAAIAPYVVLRWSEMAQGFPALLSRHLTLRVAEAASAQSVPQALAGRGLGHAQDALFAYVGAAGVRLWDSNWDFLWRDYYHSHNWLVESFLTMGAPGIVLAFVAYLAPVLWGDPAARPFAIGFSAAAALLDGLWMPLAFYLPYLALAWAVLSAPAEIAPGKEFGASRSNKAIAALMFGGMAFVLTGVAGMLAETAIRVSAVKKPLMLFVGAPPSAPLPRSLHGTDTALAEITRDALDALARLPPDRRDELNRARFDWIVNSLSEAIPRTRTPVLVMSGLSLFAMTDVTKELAWLAFPPERRDRLWREWADRMYQLAPSRTDALIPYFSHLLVERRFESVTAYSRRILTERPGDPVGLYFAGAALTADPIAARKAEGLRRIGAAVAAGIEQFMPVPDWLLKEAESYLPPKGRRP